MICGLLRSFCGVKHPILPTTAVGLGLALNLMGDGQLVTNICEYEGLEAMAYGMIKNFGLQDRGIISGFNHYSVMRMKALAPERKYTVSMFWASTASSPTTPI